MKAEIMECTCERCGYPWYAQIVRSEQGKPVSVLPIACARCKSAYWNRPRPANRKK